ncbi:MAG: PilZ domain-containing protein [Planctomycetes bacterium]|nr:PilZ domain-containing protein [Planctomycetota bacterium]
MAGIEEYGAEGGRPRRKQKKAEAKPKPPPAKKKVPVNPSGIFKAVDVPKVLREPGDFKPRLDVNMNQVNRDHMRVRIYEDIVVAYKFLKRADGTAASGVLKGELLDISEGGLQFEGELAEGVEIGALKAGDILVGMNVFLPYVDGRMKVLGQVTWQKAGETEKTLKMGVRFIDMDDAARAVLKAYFISSQMPGRRKKPPEPD